MLTVFVDPNAAMTEKRKEALSKACEDINAKIDFVPQIVEKTISWQPAISLSASAVTEDIQREVLAVLEAEDTVTMIKAYHQRKRDNQADGITLSEWVESVLLAMPGRNLTVMVVGLNKYFNKQKLNARKKYRELVTGQPAKGKKKVAEPTVSITKEEAEEVFVDVQLRNGLVVQQVDTDEDLAAQVKMFTKAVADKPAKKDRFDNIFSFLEEGSSGLSVNNKTGEGLSKVWKRQLMQFRNFGAEMAEAVQNSYPSPLSLHEACKNCISPKEAETIVGEITVRRNASVISTNRKVGKEHARRIHSFMTSTDPHQIIK